MSTKQDWTCPCRAVNSSASAYCEACGGERPGRVRAAISALARTATSAFVPETHAPAKLPEFREPTPEEDAEIREQIKRVRALLGITRPVDRPERPGLDLPPIDPAIRADVERKASHPERVAALLPPALRPVAKTDHHAEKEIP